MPKLLSVKPASDLADVVGLAEHERRGSRGWFGPGTIAGAFAIGIGVLRYRLYEIVRDQPDDRRRGP